MDTKQVVRATVAALALVATSQGALANGNAFGNSPAPAPIEGTYRVTIQPYFCATGQPVPVPPFRSILTFSRGGALHESPSMARFEPGQRVPGLGYWERTGPSDYHAVFEAFIVFDSANYVRGLQRIEQGIVQDDADHWHSEAQVTFFDVNGTVVPPTGCMRAKGERMQ
jgi:hypothetical protein